MKNNATKKDIKIRRGFLYIDGKKAWERKIHPLQVPRQFGEEVFRYCHKYAFRYYSLGEVRTNH